MVSVHELENTTKSLESILSVSKDFVESPFIQATVNLLEVISTHLEQALGTVATNTTAGSAIESSHRVGAGNLVYRLEIYTTS